MVWVFAPCTMHGVKTQKANIWPTPTTETQKRVRVQKATSMIPVLAGRSERMHVFYRSETIPPKMSRKKISGEAFSFKYEYMQCLSSLCPALTSPYDCLNSIDTTVTSDGESFNRNAAISRRKVQSGQTSKAKM